VVGKPRARTTTNDSLIQLKIDNGPESSGVRTQFLKRMVEFTEQIGKPIQLLYYPPYHSKYNPIERCWGILELHWNGAKLIDVETMVGMGSKHDVERPSTDYYIESESLRKRDFTDKKAMRAIEKKLERNPLLPKWDILIKPVEVVNSL